MNRVLIIGGGASGLAAAIAAAKSGASVTVAERNPRVGKKILSTGNGRCNFTNINAAEKSYNSDFVKYAMEKFPPEKICTIFAEMGLLSRTEAEGRVYPVCGQASAVLDVLRMETERLGVRIITEFKAAKIKKDGAVFKVSVADERQLEADRVIVAAGGCAAPKSGSDGSGHALLRQMGHRITPLVPSLVQVRTDKGIKGVRAYGKVTLENGMSEIGEIQFNDYGLSGIPVFCLSKYVKKGMKVFVDLLPDMNENALSEYLEKRSSQPLSEYLVGILNKQLGQMLLKDCGFEKLSRSSADLSGAEVRRIANYIKNWRFTVSGTMPWENAQVTSGGADTSEFNPKTMESLKVSGLYAAGEVLDADGACGGYNLQWAWASGFTAGGAAADVQD